VPDPAFASGIYESLLTEALADRLQGFGTTIRPVDETEQADVLGDFVGRRTTQALLRLPAGERVAAVNRLLAQLEGDVVEPGPQQLLAAAQQEQPGVWRLLQTRPAVPLSRPALLTNARSDPKLGSELRAELATADGVDLLCAFVKWYGLRVLEAELLDLRARGVPLRVITSTYMGATDRTALDRLVRDFGAQVKVNYETRSTRLHAKAWLFRRATGYDTAYIGSSNLSRAALLDGLEWNVKLAGSHTPELLTKFEATFDSYWSDPAFVDYDPETDAERLDQALSIAAGTQDRGTVTFSVSGLEVRPYPHQQMILDRLQLERELHDRHRNLVVAATGTGKTVVAALDYARLPHRPALLFVAHRTEILQQSLRTYREVLADGSFGELYVGGERPERWRHVFASVQSLAAYGVQQLSAEHFDVVVVDEFHHAEAASYRRLLEHLQPKELLGLTATPERTDGIDVRSFFDGRAAVELRLWDALENDLLCPFHYFGVSDATDLSQLEWRRGEYDAMALERVFTGDDARVRIVLREMRDKVPHLLAMRALGFCVSVGHAEYMAQRFSDAGIPARAVSAGTSPPDRAAALRDLRDRKVNVLFTVDLFNEGLDVPDVDTLLLLRPTQSATVFLQQLGRGLRRTADKPVLTVLDFIGQQRREFRFDLKYRALTGTSRTGLERQLEAGFGFLPSGCELVLDQVARQVVLDNVRRQLRLSRKEVVAEVRTHGDLELAAWLQESGRELADVFRFGSWTGLRRAAGLPAPATAPADEQLLKRSSALAHVDDPERACTCAWSVTASSTPTCRSGSSASRACCSSRSGPTVAASATTNRASTCLPPAARDEFRQVLGVALAAAEHVSGPLEAGLQQVTMRTNAHYSREETLAALDWACFTRKPSAFVAGVVWSEPVQTDTFFVTLRKSERDYSPRTMYRDFALSPELFHWESQNATALASATGQRYVHHREQGSHVLILARELKTSDWGGPRPFRCLGPASYVSHEGERPMAVTWRLRHTMPTDVFRSAAVTA